MCSHCDSYVEAQVMCICFQTIWGESRLSVTASMACTLPMPNQKTNFGEHSQRGPLPPFRPLTKKCTCHKSMVWRGCRCCEDGPPHSLGCFSAYHRSAWYTQTVGSCSDLIDKDLPCTTACAAALQQPQLMQTIHHPWQLCFLHTISLSKQAWVIAGVPS